MKLALLTRHFILLVVAILYGVNYSIVKIVTPEYIPPFGFIVVRVGMATLCFLLISIGSQEKINWQKDGSRVALCAFFGVGINMLFFFKGLSLTSAINSSLIMTLTPMIILIISYFLLHEKVTRLKVFGLALGFLGTFLIIYKSNLSTYTGDWRGDLLIILNASSYGTYLVIVKPLLAKYQPLTIAKWVFLIGFFMVLPVGYTELIAIRWATFPPAVYWSLAFVVLGVTVLVYISNIWAMQKVNPSTIGVYIYVQPVFATLVASLFFDEVLTIKHLIAAILVFSGVGLVIWKPKEQLPRSRQKQHQ